LQVLLVPLLQVLQVLPPRLQRHAQQPSHACSSTPPHGQLHFAARNLQQAEQASFSSSKAKIA
jgi:hypothetical protein